jgi:hypothetical protein
VPWESQRRTSNHPVGHPPPCTFNFSSGVCAAGARRMLVFNLLDGQIRVWLLHTRAGPVPPTARVEARQATNGDNTGSMIWGGHALILLLHDSLRPHPWPWRRSSRATTEAGSHVGHNQNRWNHGKVAGVSFARATIGSGRTRGGLLFCSPFVARSCEPTEQPCLSVSRPELQWRRTTRPPLSARDNN